jgi:hypothetical protein
MTKRLRRKLGKGEYAYPYNHHPKMSEQTKQALATMIEVAYVAAQKGILPDETQYIQLPSHDN